jgi:dihydroorotate dehydrogenase
LTLIAAGGIETPDDAWERIRAGASLVQVYTALVYQGPSLPRRLNQGLPTRLRTAGYGDLSQAIGVDADHRA